MAHPGGRPTEYNEEMLAKANEYLSRCKDEKVNMGNEEYPRFEMTVRIPTKGGLARYLGVARDTLYTWAKEYPEFSDIMEDLGAEQEDRLIANGLSGDYNPTIAKVLLTKHGYREGQDITTNDKDIPTPILGGLTLNEDKRTDTTVQ